jgi:hypothetical protein
MDRATAAGISRYFTVYPRYQLPPRYRVVNYMIDQNSQSVSCDLYLVRVEPPSTAEFSAIWRAFPSAADGRFAQGKFLSAPVTFDGQIQNAQALKIIAGQLSRPFDFTYHSLPMQNGPRRSNITLAKTCD